MIKLAVRWRAAKRWTDSFTGSAQNVPIRRHERSNEEGSKCEKCEEGEEGEERRCSEAEAEAEAIITRTSVEPIREGRGGRRGRHDLWAGVRFG